MEAGTGIHARKRGARPGLGRIAAVLGVGALGGIGVGVGIGLHDLLGGRAVNVPVAARATDGLHGEATWAAGAQPAPAISTLRDQSGRLFSLSALQGRTALIAFFDSHCNQACPLEGRALAAAERAMPRTQRPVLVAISVNPLDTPGSTRAAMRKWGLAQVGSWVWLRGSHAQLAAVWHAYHIFVAPTKGDIVHTEALYLLDRTGDERSAYLYPFMPRFVSADLKLLARKAGGHD